MAVGDRQDIDLKSPLGGERCQAKPYVCSFFSPRRVKRSCKKQESLFSCSGQQIQPCMLLWQLGQAMLKRVDHQLKTIRDAELGED
jgi:hypothetical protein